MASQTQSQRMQDLDLDLEQVDLDLIGPLEPADKMQARFLQIYFMDGNQQIQRDRRTL